MKKLIFAALFLTFVLLAGAAQAQQDGHIISGDETTPIVSPAIPTPDKSKVPDWLKPGFEAVLVSQDHLKLVYVYYPEARGLVFGGCEGKEISPAACPSLWPDGILFPPEEIINNSIGFWHHLKVRVRAFFGGVIVAVGSSQYSWEFNAFQGLISLFSIQPLEALRREQNANEIVKDLFRFETEKERLEKLKVPLAEGEMVSVLTNTPYDQLVSGLMFVLAGVIAKEQQTARKLPPGPNNSSGYQNQMAVHADVNARRKKTAADEEKAAAEKGKTKASGDDPGDDGNK